MLPPLLLLLLLLRIIPIAQHPKFNLRSYLCTFYITNTVNTCSQFIYFTIEMLKWFRVENCVFRVCCVACVFQRCHVCSGITNLFLLLNANKEHKAGVFLISWTYPRSEDQLANTPPTRRRAQVVAYAKKSAWQEKRPYEISKSVRVLCCL